MIDTLARLLHAHSVETVLYQDRLYAEMGYNMDRVSYDEWVDVTDWTVRAVLGWLGY